MKKLATYALLGALVSMSVPAYAVPIVTGGVGDEGRAAIRSMQNDYSLKVVFAGERGIFLSDVNVQILDHQGNLVVDNVTDGPMLLAALPPGHYVLQASTDGLTRRQSFTVGAGGLRTLYVRFPISDGINIAPNI